MERVPVALLRSRDAAESIRNRLVHAGFDACIAEAWWLQRLWFVRKAEAGVSVVVTADQLDRAEKLLIEWDAAEGVLRDAIRCPECKSLRVQYPQFARHSLLTNLTMGIAAGIGLVEKEYYCLNCHFTWPKEGIRARREQPQLPSYSFINGVEQTTLPPQPAAQQKRQAA